MYPATTKEMYDAALSAMFKDLITTIRSANPDDARLKTIGVLMDTVDISAFLTRDVISRQIRGRETAIANKEHTAFDGMIIAGIDMKEMFHNLDDATKNVVFDKLNAIVLILQISDAIPSDMAQQLSGIAESLVQTIQTRPELVESVMSTVMNMVPNLLVSSPELIGMFQNPK
jgi:hypothetical protein